MCCKNLSDVVKDKQVAVVAGTAADADRVAYVKTVRPTSMEADDRPTSEIQPDSQPRYTNEVQSWIKYSLQFTTNRLLDSRVIKQ